MMAAKYWERKYTIRDAGSHENLGPASYELAAAYEAALRGGQTYIVINPHSVPRKVYIEHGYSPENLGKTHAD